MSDQERRLDEERRWRRAAVTAATQQAPEPQEPPDPNEESEEESVEARRMQQQTLWVDLQVRQAMERGEFDNLPGAGKPLKLPDRHDPDWWVKNLVRREDITGVLPAALLLRKDDAELDAVLDREATEQGVRRVVEDFNRRVVDARRQLQGGPPVVTPTRDVDQEVAAWHARRSQRGARRGTQRREERRALEREQTSAPRAEPARRERARWWSRRKR